MKIKLTLTAVAAVLAGSVTAALGLPAPATAATGAGYGMPQAAQAKPVAVAVSHMDWLTSVGCDPSATICLAGGVLQGPNGLTAGNPVVVSVAPWGPGSPVSTNGLYVHGISCVSASICVVVGETNDYSFGGSQAEWEIVTLSLGVIHVYPAHPVGSLQSLSGLACLSTSECVSLGADSTGSAVADINLGTDSAVLARAPDFSPLTALACPQVTHCVVGGGQANSSGNSLVATYAPGASVLGSEHPVTGDLRGVACPGAVTCQALTEVNGPAGAIQPVDVATGVPGTATLIPGGGTGAGGGAYYNAIACAAGNGCVAVGAVNTDLSNYASPTRAVTVPIVKGVVGTPRTLQPTETSDSLFAMTCPDFDQCYGVGFTARAGGPGQATTGMAVAMNGQGTAEAFTSPNAPDGSPCPGNGRKDGPVMAGGKPASNFQAVTYKSASALGGVYATIGAASVCRDTTDALYPSTWVMLSSAGGGTFVQGGIAYHQHPPSGGTGSGGPDHPFVELSPDLWTSSNADYHPPASDGIVVGSSLDFTHWNGTSSGTFTILDYTGQQSHSTEWCSWVPQDVRSHPELEGAKPSLLSPAYKVEIYMNGYGPSHCLWIFYLPTDHAPLAWANVAAETHTLWEHVPGTLASPLVFSGLHAYYNGGWHDFANGSTLAYACNTDAGDPFGTGSGYTFSAWATMTSDNALDPACKDTR